MDLPTRFLYVGLGFLLTLVFGFWLSHRGRPYNGLLFNVHKLIALASVILAAVWIFQLLKILDIQTPIAILLVISALSVVALFLTGALMSASRGEYRTMKLIHHVSPFVLVLSAAFTAYLV
ncbi:MAG: hypothetical protein ACM3XO_06515 [Bacteroidota bacterium]